MGAFTPVVGPGLSMKLSARRLENSRSAWIQDLQFFAGDSYLRTGRLAEAEYLLVQELNEFPRNARTRVSLSQLYRTTGRTDEAASLSRR